MSEDEIEQLRTTSARIRIKGLEMIIKLSEVAMSQAVENKINQFFCMSRECNHVSTTLSLFNYGLTDNKLLEFQETVKSSELLLGEVYQAFPDIQFHI